LLQGWAIVDNTVGEDWNNVELSLVAGAPQSFIQQLSQPYYGRRAVVPLPQEYQQAPQTHEQGCLVARRLPGESLILPGASSLARKSAYSTTMARRSAEQQATTAANTVCQAFPTETTGLRLKVKDSIGWW